MPRDGWSAPSGNDVSESDSGKSSPQVARPSLTLPKGGGAIKGIGEKFAANPVTGTGSMTVPIAISPSRSGFGPQLSLSYDSGSGNGPFGFGWSLSAPAITRKTDKGLPQYDDAGESDVYILSGAEDLVPVVGPDGKLFVDSTTVPDFTIHRYRPRIEGLFARIERWTRSDGEIHWRSISKDNILTVYGRDENSRIADPLDTRRIFSWLICETHDDKGNAILYQYKREDGAGVDLVRPCERNRGDRSDARRSANRYLKRIRYGNRSSLLVDGKRTHFLNADQLQNAGWMFEVVFDYGEHDTEAPKPDNQGEWDYRKDPFSSYRAGFEVRTTRLCQRVLMFHHFPEDAGIGEDCLVRSTDFTYSHEQDPNSTHDPVYTFLRSVAQTGYRRDGGNYRKRSLPPVDFGYSTPTVEDEVRDVDAEFLDNLPIGLDGTLHQWTDLHGEGIPGILTEQAGAWFYKRNLSPLPVKGEDGREQAKAQFSPLETVAAKPNLALTGGQAQFMDLAGDGQPDLVVMDGPSPGFCEHDDGEGWQPFRPFTARLNRDMHDPNLRFVDLDGDGHADVLITEDDAFVWHASRAEEGFGEARRVCQAIDEEDGPRLVFADGTQSIYLADMSGDGLADLVRVRNGNVCYWPNMGYCRFGAKIAMDYAPNVDDPPHEKSTPFFDDPDRFDHRRVRLADIDGTGTTDIIYLHPKGVRVYFNQSGNSWSKPLQLKVFPRIDDLVSIATVDLLGNGTACLVWSSPLPGDARRPMRYINLIGEQKPHLLVRIDNNLGAETQVHYAPSPKFYLQDRRDGKSWITRLPFPVHVVERVETYDHISRNRFATRYAYHHGHFDGEEREFRGFGMVEQWDTEEFATLSSSNALPPGENFAQESHVPPAYTKTWFHTGIYFSRNHVSDFFAGMLNATDQDEYFREPGLKHEGAEALLLPDTVLPSDLTLEEEREACRALKGAMLRQEVYGLDGSEKEKFPYTVTEQNFAIRKLQSKAGNRHGVFLTHPREAINFHYERNPSDPRIQHALTLEVDEYGNVLKEAAIAYGRRETIRKVDDQGNVQLIPNPGLGELTQPDRNRQTGWLAIYTENRVTSAIDDVVRYPGDYRAPLSCETMTFELTGYTPTGPAGRFRAADLVEHDAATDRLRHIFLKEFAYEEVATGEKRRRAIEWVRTLFRRDSLADLLPLGGLEPLALPGESYKLAFTPGLLDEVFQRSRAGRPPETLLPDPDTVLAGQVEDRGGYVKSRVLKADGRFPGSDADDPWWIPSGRVFYSPDAGDAPAVELAYAGRHFFLPHRFRDPFGRSTFVTYDSNDADPQKSHNLLLVRIEDALGNTTTAINDYRVLQPRLVADPNLNRTEVAFDALGMVVGTAIMGKPPPVPAEGDTLEDFRADLTQDEIDDFHGADDPHVAAPGLLKGATTRIVYDLDRFRRTRDENPADPTKWLPVYAASLARETHVGDPLPARGLRIQINLSFSDGFGREIQKKIQAEPGPLVDGGPVVSPRWVGSGWTVFNNKGNPIRQYEPFFSDRERQDGTHFSDHRFEFGTKVGVSPILFYDPVGRVVATLHPNHSWEKVVFDPWRQESWDVNDTVAADPQIDNQLKGFLVHADGTLRLPAAEYLPTWHGLRTDPAQAAEANRRWPDPKIRAAENTAADKAVVHAMTPSVAHFDTLGRPFLTIAHNRFQRDGAIVEERYPTRVEMDIEGNQRAVIDARGRMVMRYAYDMLGTRIHQASMEAGERWMLNDAMSNPIRAWDGRGFVRRMTYDALRRPTGLHVTENGAERLVERIVYGEGHPAAVERNLRGKVFRQYDQAGAVTNPLYDFKGNPRESSRRLAREYKEQVDWSGIEPLLDLQPDALLDLPVIDAASAPLLEAADPFESSTVYDALNRPVAITTPDGSVCRATFNEANLLDKVDVNLRGTVAATAFVTNIDYDAKGQRTLIIYGNGARTTYHYDPLTFRLVRMRTTRLAGLNGLAQIFADATLLQDLHYTYDPAGNITRIEDQALKTIVHGQQTVEPVSAYTYDAIYRLIEAKGREHIGQAAREFNPLSRRDFDFAGLAHFLAHPNDLRALRSYTEHYEYDAVGNFDVMRHAADGGGWTRRYFHEEESLTEPSQKSNRLTRSVVGNGLANTETYSYADALGSDVHGCMSAINSMTMTWDFEDQLHEVDLGGGGAAYYVYIAGGQRIRKVIRRPNGTRKEERIYVGGCEVYREFGSDGQAVSLERETLHVMDDRQRIALVDTKTKPAVDQPLIRYQFGNHLGSASIELDGGAGLICYEEYHPYGTTSFQVKRTAEVSPKRYRYTGKERDEETGLYYHGARYYAPWMGRWVSCDPISIGAGLNLYIYVHGSPIVWHDPTGNQEQVWLWNQKQLTIDPVATRTTRGITPLQHQALRGLDYGFGPNEGAHWGHPEGQSFVTQPAGTQVTLSPETAAENLKKSHLSRAEGKAAAAAGKFKRVNDADLTVAKGTSFPKPPPKPFERPFASYESTITSEGLGGAFLPPDQAYQVRLNFEPPPPIGLASDSQLPLNFDPQPAAPAATPDPSPVSTPPPKPTTPASPVAKTGSSTTVAPKIPSPPSRAQKAAAWALEVGPKALKTAGQITTLVGAISEGAKTSEYLRSRGAPEVIQFTNFVASTVVVSAAGVVDDAFAAAEVQSYGAPVLTAQSWDQHNAGPVQHAVGKAYRWLLSLD